MKIESLSIAVTDLNITSIEIVPKTNRATVRYVRALADGTLIDSVQTIDATKEPVVAAIISWAESAVLGHAKAVKVQGL